MMLAGVTGWLEYVAVTIPFWIVNTWKLVLFVDGVPPTIAPPADTIPFPVGSFDAMLAADSAIIAPSGTMLPLISSILVIVRVVVPGAAPLTVTVAGLALMVAEWATYWRSAGATLV